MKDFPTWLAVVAAAIEDREGRFLLQKRGPKARHPGLWEFPGGKVEAGEMPRNALVREIEEELGLVLAAQHLRPMGFAEEAGTDVFPAIVMNLYGASNWTGEVQARDGQEFGWFAPDAAAALAMPSMDVFLLEGLRRTR